MRLRKTELLIVDRNAILQYLHEFRSLRIKPAIAEIDDGRVRFLAYQDPRCRCHHLTIIVIRNGWKFVRLNERGLLAGVDSSALHLGQSGIWRQVHIESPND